MFDWLEENRRIVTRFDKLAKNYGAMVSLACVMRCLRHLFSDRTYRAFGFLLARTFRETLALCPKLRDTPLATSALRHSPDPLSAHHRKGRPLLVDF